jgi:Cdc6-like AAA superfamily ATPase
VPLNTGNKQLVASLRNTFTDLLSPLETSIRTVWRGTTAPPEAKLVLDNQLLSIARRFVNLREASAEEKQRYYEELCRAFQLKYESNTFPLTLRHSFSESVADRLDRAPVILSYLEEYDARHGSNFADRARHALFQFTNLVIKSDGRVTDTETIELLKFKQALYPRGTAAPPEDAQTKGKEKEGEALEHESDGVDDAPARPLEELLAELNELVGLERVKAEVKQLTNFLKVQQMREEKGLATLPVSRHLVFSGNPGTGKTTIARLLAQIYRSLKILSRGHLLETDRSALVAGYVGQTAIKVKEVVTKSLGGILFIDEAYALSPPAGSGNDFGHEAVETLLKMMEDHRDDLIVVAAGYTGRMDQFLSSNPGLRSRFNKFIHFDDYDSQQLVQIFKSFCKKADFKVTPEAEKKLTELFDSLTATRDETFGNARTARNLFEAAISLQANRIVQLAEINEEVLQTIEAADIPAAKDLNTSGIQITKTEDSPYAQ